MTKVEKTIKNVSELLDFYKKIKKIKKYDNKQKKPHTFAATNAFPSGLTPNS